MCMDLFDLGAFEPAQGKRQVWSAQGEFPSVLSLTPGLPLFSPETRVLRGHDL